MIDSKLEKHCGSRYNACFTCFTCFTSIPVYSVLVNFHLIWWRGNFRNLYSFLSDSSALSALARGESPMTSTGTFLVCNWCETWMYSIFSANAGVSFASRFVLSSLSFVVYFGNSYIFFGCRLPQTPGSPSPSGAQVKVSLAQFYICLKNFLI